jgi:ABC-2 type transport system ATP-binding protein
MIGVAHLCFDYPGVRALDDVSFSIGARSITALVGPNGAGKTTLLRCLAALDRPLLGEIVIDGIDVVEEPRECHRRIGYLADVFGLYEELTVRQSLTYVARANRVPADTVAGAVDRAARQLGIADRLEARGNELSRGLRQRLAIAQSIIHLPRVLILDEPASGLDPEARHSLARLFVELRDQGMTLIVSSHVLAELEEYCTDMLILRQGRLLERTPVRGRHPEFRLLMTLTRPHPQAAELLSRMEGVGAIVAEDLDLRFSFSGDAPARHRLLAALIEAGVPVCGLAEEQRTLQASYLASLRSGAGSGSA